MANKISVIIDVAVDKATGALGGFKKSIQDAEGAAGKMKAGVTSAFDSIKANAGNLAIAGGAAVVAFGAKAVGEFQRTALEAGKMSEALGIPVEDMSRLIEVAGDLSIESSTLEASLGKMNLTAGKTPAAFDEIGASIVRNKDGTINVKDTFLEVSDALNAMPDAATRAEAAQRIFGKGWKDMAELIGQGATGVAEAMALVSEGKIIDEEEVQKARDLREAQDKLKDAIDDISLAVGEALVPALSDMAESFVGVYEVAQKLKILDVAGFIQEWLNPVNGAKKALDEIFPSYRNVTQAAWDYASAIEDQGGSFDRALAEYEAMEATNRTSVETTLKAIDAAIKHGEAVTEFESVTRDAADATGIVNEAIQASLDLHRKEAEALDKVREARRLGTDNIYAAKAAEDAWWEQVKQTTEALEDAEVSERDKAAATRDLATATDEAVTSQLIANGVNVESEAGHRAWTEAMLASAAGLSGPMRDEVLNYIALVTGIPAEKLTTIMVKTDLSSVQRAIATINGTKFNMSATVPTPQGNIGLTGVGATGGIVTQATRAIIGENGPEAVIPLNQMPGASPLGGMGGGTTTININMPPGSNGDDVVRALREHVRRNGPIQGIT